ncbi:ABC transporter permease [Sulfitobacter sp. M57]|uniref:ABC transporter permease n=1 Tax=unclassified Sulfitobacter TaxID=196795 RepID=UPI0023E2309F|nr:MULTISPECIES: ABC transporter permease [unclassified Sulfitobacter]MDF3414931.1 ABC transporter permease [Sulfitobacter sp. KE5]MDF3422412.1 ABC transporter permease [Sulfitobacter sp. KE43]MDF3433477.1 ABC transporter permease [Sulfitobacter sp. KE42]MDF3459117.1 ABC transporter permease [Sulfitobacter sp. S74]MDF3463016.1 ABC transporter permease [Sulfitobacter sp. Ks18]
MFQSKRKPKGGISSFLSMAELVYHSIVRSVRKQHNNAFIAIGINVAQTAMFVGAFYLMFTILGVRGSAIRGDFLVYIMTGIFLYLTHIKAIGSVMGAEGPASPMMQHAPMNTIIAILSGALGALYIQVLSLFLVLFAYHVAWSPVSIDQPVNAFLMVVMSWFTGCSLGLVFLAIKPWFPAFVSLASQLYQRANMLASGKMFVANTLPGYMLAMFDWNPLFHTIDQARGFAFINYNPRYSNWEYAFWLSIVLIMIGLMGEFYTRKHASLSWNARR